MSENEVLACLRLQIIPNIGDKTAKKLISRCGSPTAVFTDKLQHLLKIDGIGRRTVGELHSKKYLAAAERELIRITRHNLKCLYYGGDGYPAYLNHCADGPIVLFGRGNIRLEGRKIISVVGTRNMTSYGREFSERFIAEIAPLNPIIVSGFAYGVDICVMKAAMDHNLQTIGCLAHGFRQVYPQAHRRYVEGMENNGGFLTEFWWNTRPDRENFLKRNRIIAGISEATVVVESAEKGGSLVTADLAAGYHRDVFALPGRAMDTFSVGCNRLIQYQKAQLITSAADLVYMLGWDLEEKEPRPVQKQLFADLEPAEEVLYHYLQNNGRKMLDTIALECNMPVFKAASVLLSMEMKGVIRPLPGKLFESL